MSDYDLMAELVIAARRMAEAIGDCLECLGDAASKALDDVAAWVMDFEMAVNTEEYKAYERRRRKAVERSRRNNAAMRREERTR